MSMIGHNSVQIPHNGHFKTIKGATFKGPHFRPTMMSEALSKAGVIPGTHMTEEVPVSLICRERNDTKNIRQSVRLLV